MDKPRSFSRLTLLVPETIDVSHLFYSIVSVLCEIERDLEKTFVSSIKLIVVTVTSARCILFLHAQVTVVSRSVYLSGISVTCWISTNRSRLSYQSILQAVCNYNSRQSLTCGVTTQAELVSTDGILDKRAIRDIGMQKEVTPKFHHYSLTFPPEQIKERLKDLKFLLVAGSLRRLKSQAEYLRSHGIPNSDCQLEVLTEPESRFGLIQLGCCLFSDHGMGSASMSIALHELFLMCRFAGVLDKITLIRLGTCK